MSNYDIDNELIDLDNLDNSGNSSNNKKHHKRKKKNLWIAISAMLTCLLVIGVIFYVSLANNYKAEQQQHEEDILSLKHENEQAIAEVYETALTPENVDKMVNEAYEKGDLDGSNRILSFVKEQSSQKGASLAEMLRQLYKNDIVYLTNNGYEFIPINNTYPKNNILASDLSIDDDGFLSYAPNGEKKSTLGIDVSEHQGEIDWDKVADTDVSFVMVRVGYRGYGSGKLVDDAEFENNMKGAISHNLDTGVYYFTQAITQEEMQEEIDVILEGISPYKFDGPVAIDIEKVDGSNARANDISKEERTELVKYFCEKIREAGYTPMIYGNTHSLFAMLDIDQVHDEKIWFAFYNPDYLYYPYELDYWQYSAAGKIDGIKGEVDLNISLK